jgi:SAM-dependent MidA family methyltransferase
MNACAQALSERIAREGPIRFSDFMRLALYLPGHGYYMRRRAGHDPFGRQGDFFTAVQLQPVFGRLMRSLAERWEHRAVLDWGAGREEMREAFVGLDYTAVDVATPAPPTRQRCFLLANELFDALPLDLAVRRAGLWHQCRVTAQDGAFRLCPSEPLQGEWLEYARGLEEFLPEEEAEPLLELPVEMEPVLARMSASTTQGHLLVLDYGYRSRELIRFPQGTLMSYRKHRASADVLRDPGEQDITAHVAFDYLECVASRQGWKRVRRESMASLLLFAGEPDQFSSALRCASEADEQRLRLQLKTLLFGMGETFHALLFERHPVDQK